MNMTINASYLLPVRTASCSTMGDYAIKKKLTVPYSKARKGDIVLYDFNHNGTSDHTGIIYKVEGNKIYVAEGNTSLGNNCNGGMVMTRARTKSQVNYIVRPKYDDKVTADMIVKTALAEVGTKESPSGSNQVKYNTWFYGKAVHGSAYPWCMVFVEWCFYHVKEAEKPLPKPMGKYGFSIPLPTLKKGSKGNKVALLQKFLKWYGCSLKVDGDFGAKTEAQLKRFQKAEEIKVDGVYANQSYGKAKAYLPKPLKVDEPKKEEPVDKGKKTKAQKMLAEMDKLAWKYGTPKKRYSYKKGRPRNACKEAMAKHGYKTKEKLSSCVYFANTLVRDSGVNKSFCAGHGYDKPYPKHEKGFDTVIVGRVPKVKELKPADMIRYKKKNKDEHVMFYYGHNRICDAGHYNRFANIRKNDFRYKRRNVKKSTIQVLRPKG